MFRKYILMTAAVLLASTVRHAPAQAEQLNLPEMGVNPTYGTLCSSFCPANSTFQGYTATSESFIPTHSANHAVSLGHSPTGFPQTALLSASSGQQIPSTGHDYTTQSVLMQEQMMLNLLNQDRKNNGLPALAHDEELSRIARIKSADMRDHGYFAHESPTWGNVRAMLKRFGYPYAGASENIAHHANVDKAQAAFMSSAGHRANILSKSWTKVGVGIVYDAQGYIYATQIFAR